MQDEIGTPIRRPRPLSWLAYIVGVLTPALPLCLGIAWDRLSEPPAEIYQASELLARLSPQVEAYRSQSDLMNVRARRVATIMTRGGGPTDADDRYDDFLLTWSDFQTTWSDLLVLVKREGGGIRPELAKLAPYINRSANVASNRIDVCLLAASGTYDASAQQVMAGRARSAPTGDSATTDRRFRLTCPTRGGYFLMEDQLARTGACNYAIRRAFLVMQTDLRETRDSGPLARLGQRLSFGAKASTTREPSLDWKLEMGRVDRECSEKQLTPATKRLLPGQTLYPWQGAVPIPDAPVVPAPPVVAPAVSPSAATTPAP